MSKSQLKRFSATPCPKCNGTPSICAYPEACEHPYRQAWRNDPRLYDIARDICHSHGWPWTDPRTGITYLPPKH